MRVQGGFSGILSAIDAGWLDPLDARLPEERIVKRLTPAGRRAILLRERRRAKLYMRRLALRRFPASGSEIGDGVEQPGSSLGS